MSKKKTSISTSEVLDEVQTSASTNKGASTKMNVSLKEFSKNAPFSFNAKNYKVLFVGLGINILGFLLMIGGASEDPNHFDAGSLFSPVRITLAPMLIVAGYVVIMYAIMKKPKNTGSETSDSIK